MSPVHHKAGNPKFLLTHSSAATFLKLPFNRPPLAPDSSFTPPIWNRLLTPVRPSSGIQKSDLQRSSQVRLHSFTDAVDPVLDPAKHPSPTAIAPIVVGFVATYRFDLRKSDTKLPTDSIYLAAPSSPSGSIIVDLLLLSRLSDLQPRPADLLLSRTATKHRRSASSRLTDAFIIPGNGSDQHVGVPSPSASISASGT
ncbi:hypothetical protein L2E82_01068 [Cichorium intybus]|uniref:Uncharacterized protein n=1 Tax=Cichorium intybus TaxID=13427 RepID=A0ACB9H009_CICIN|nr:hypothetical protein L2E82_01068 [Cichorium intybus]